MTIKQKYLLKNLVGLSVDFSCFLTVIFTFATLFVGHLLWLAILFGLICILLFWADTRIRFGP